MATTNVYVLKLKDGKYYVGKSADVQRRFKEHQKGNGSLWTRKYKPIEIECVHKNVSSFEEDKITKELMAKHGIDNVRGGTYVSEELDVYQKDTLQREIWSASDSCTTCGRSGHFASSCYARTTVTGERIEYESEEDEESEYDYYEPICYKCRTIGHYATTCWKR